MKKAMWAMASFLLLGTALHAGGAGEATKSGANETKERAKYVFLFIGDGMAMGQISATEVYAKALAGSGHGFQKLGFTQFPAQGMTTTYDSSSIITDSASAGTAMATGYKTLSGVINMDETKTKSYGTIAEMARDAGMKVGVVSNVSLDHATPASMYAKVPSRSNMYDIALQLGKSGFDYFGGGGLAQPTGKNKDQPDAVALASQAGYTVVTTKAGFQALKPGIGKVLAMNETLQDSAAMPYDMDRKEGDLSLADYTAKGIELLSDSPKGFFMMVESGKIDWACHANDAAASIRDNIAFDQAIAKAVEFAAKHPQDTLIVVTGDHETGGMSIGFAGTQYSTFFDKVARQKGSYLAFNDTVLSPYKKSKALPEAKLEDLIPAMEDWFGIEVAKLTPSERELLERSFVRTMKGEVERAPQENIALLYGGYEPLTVTLTHLANQAAGIGWTSYSHTGVPVATFAKGPGQALFQGYYDNTDVFKKLKAVMGL